MNTSGWTSIEEFLSARKSPNAILLDFERESVIREDALDKPLEQQEDHALAFETSTTRYNNSNNVVLIISSKQYNITYILVENCTLAFGYTL